MIRYSSGVLGHWSWAVDLKRSREAGFRIGAMKMKRRIQSTLILVVLLFTLGWAGNANGWHDETHIAIAKVAGYYKWFNATGADMAKLKIGELEGNNHYVNNPLDTVVTPDMVFQQVARYNRLEETGHLYGAIIASLRDYVKDKEEGKYGEYHLGFCAHYVGDLSQPLHNIVYDTYNQTYHNQTDGIINDEVLDNLSKIEVYAIYIDSEADLAREVARIANISIALGKQLEADNRMMTKQEAYRQIGHSASLFKAVLKYVETLK